MDIYRALNADVPLSLFSVLHQAVPTMASEEYLQLVTSFHHDVHALADSLGDELQQWQQKQYLDHAEEMVGKLQREGHLAEKVEIALLKDALIRDYQRLGSRIGSRSLVGLLGDSEVVLDQTETMPEDADLAGLITSGQQYLAALGFQAGQGVMHETWLLFRGSVHYDIMEHLLRNRTGLYQGNYDKPLASIRHVAINTYDLVYQTGEGLTAEPHEHVPMQQVTFAIDSGTLSYSLFRQDAAIMMEDVGEHVLSFHASLWQRKLGLGVGREFLLRFRLLEGQEHVQSLVHALNTISSLGRTVVQQGAMMVGRRVL